MIFFSSEVKYCCQKGLIFLTLFCMPCYGQVVLYIVGFFFVAIILPLIYNFSRCYKYKYKYIQKCPQYLRALINILIQNALRTTGSSPTEGSYTSSSDHHKHRRCGSRLARTCSRQRRLLGRRRCCGRTGGPSWRRQCRPAYVGRGAVGCCPLATRLFQYGGLRREC